MERKDIYIELLDRFMRGELPAEQEHELWTWFRQPGIRELLFQHYRQFWTEAEGKELPVEIQNRMFRNIQRNQDQFESYSSASGCPMRRLLCFY